MTSINDFLLPNTKLEVKIIDINDPEVLARIKETQEEQRRVIESKNIDWELASRTYITI
jgi:phosphoribosylcarboxyaminoimidazole (NCAIR) mutase